jgi:hypothetical protein
VHGNADPRLRVDRQSTVLVALQGRRGAVQLVDQFLVELGDDVPAEKRRQGQARGRQRQHDQDRTAGQQAKPHRARPDQAGSPSP